MSKIQEPHEEARLTISNFQVDYDQLGNKIYLQVATETENDSVANVHVQIVANEFPLDTMFTLNDIAQAGDLIAMNGIYSGDFDILLPFQEYLLKAVVQTHSDIEVNSEEYILIEEQFLPEFVELIFWKKYADGSGYEIDYNNSSFFINDEDTSYLYFQIKIKDLNGLENIQSIRYQTITNWYYADGEGCNSDCMVDCITTSPVFYMSNIASNDSIFTYEAINDYIKEPGFEINPTSICNRFGVITFNFVAFDTFYGSLAIEEINLLFSNCSEGDWNCEEDCQYCPGVCLECEE